MTRILLGLLGQPDVLALHAQFAQRPHVLPQRGGFVDGVGPLPQPGRVAPYHVELAGRRDPHLTEPPVVLAVDDDLRTVTQRNEAAPWNLVRTGGPLLGL